MKSCINGATSMPYSLEDDIVAAGKAGFEGVELWADKVRAYLENHSIDSLRRLLETNHVEPVTLCPFSLDMFRYNEESLLALAWGAQIAQAIGCPTVLVCPDAPSPTMTSEEAFDKGALAASKLADLTGEYGVSIAIEPLARHPFIPGCTEAMAIVSRANHPHLGLMMDTFHYYASGVSSDDIRKIPVEKLLVVHLNDSQNLPLEELNDGHRVYMTLGCIPLVDELRILRDEVGYTGYVSVEIFCEEYWEDPAQKIADDSKKYYDILMESVNGS